MNNSIKFSGKFKLECHRKDGTLKWATDWFNNGITNAGKAQIALLAGDATAVPFTYLAVGTSTTAFGASQTALQAETTTNGLARAAGTVSRVTTTVTNDTLQLVKTWTATGAVSVEEIGIFNDSSAGTMLCRALTTTKTVSADDTLTATYKVAFA